MTQEQMTALAREYAEYNCFAPHIESICKGFLNYVLRRYCLVDKSKAANLCRLTWEHGDSVDYGLIDGLTDIVCDIFPEQYQQVADNPEIAKEVEG